MTEKENNCPLCDSTLEPTRAVMIKDFYEIGKLTTEAYKTAFEGSCASVQGDHLEYRRLLKKLGEIVQQHNHIVEKYMPILNEINS